MNNKKTPPVLVGRKENCCGCSACYAACPVQAICMQEDEEGFMYPVINAEICIRCQKCMRVCAFKKDKSVNEG